MRKVAFVVALLGACGPSGKVYTAAELEAADKVCAEAHLLYRDAVEPSYFAPEPEVVDAAAKQKALETAVQRLDHCIRLNPHQSYSFVLRANAHWSLQNLQAAVLDFTKAFELSGRDEEIANRGFVRVDLGQLAAAREDLKLLRARSSRFAGALTQDIAAAEVHARCPRPPPPAAHCSGWEEGFVEAYTEFFFATPEEMVWSELLDAPERPSQNDKDFAQHIGERLTRLSCFSVTEVELEALGDALNLKRSPFANAPGNEQKLRELIEAITGRAPTDAEIKAARIASGTHFSDRRYPSGGCTTYYEVPAAFVEALQRSPSAEDLGARWLKAILDAGPNPLIASDERADGDPRNEPSEWVAIARDLQRFAQANHCAERRLYVEVGYDC